MPNLKSPALQTPSAWLDSFFVILLLINPPLFLPAPARNGWLEIESGG